MKRLRHWMPLAALQLALLMAGCRASTENIPGNIETYTVTGTVISVDPEHSGVVLQHGAIPGLMEAMTMTYMLQRGEIANELHPGDVIRARLLTLKDKDGVYHQPHLDEIVILAQKRLDVKPPSNYHVPSAGDAVPDFAFTDQDGKSMHLSQLHGKTVLLTFIYTRCPVDDFCPRMSRNLAEINRALSKDPALYQATHLLSVSFDPVYDTPSVLRAYGSNYVSNADFSHWQFVRPDAKALPDVEHFFNLGATPEANQTITHSLSTVVIDPAGKIAEWYPGSEWAPADVVSKMRSVSSK